MATTIAVVIPVLRGDPALRGLVDEISEMTRGEHVTPTGRPFRVSEVVVCHDGGSESSSSLVREIGQKHTSVSTVWLSNAFGLHAATMAGMAATTASWILTVEESGGINTGDFAKMLDRAFETKAQVVYGSLDVQRFSKRRFVLAMFGHRRSVEPSPFRLLQGEIGRGVAAHCSAGANLDVAIEWVARKVTSVSVSEPRGTLSEPTARDLASEFWQLFLTSNARPLRWVGLFGLMLATLGALGLVSSPLGAGFGIPVTMLALGSLFATLAGLGLMSMALIGEYLGLVVGAVAGRPLFMVVTDPERPFQDGN